MPLAHSRRFPDEFPTMSMKRTDPRPSFTLGITGNVDQIFDTDPDSPFTEANLRERLATLFLFIRYGADTKDVRDKTGTSYYGDAMKKLVANPLEVVGLEDWGGVGSETELVLLSSLAPGADTVAAQVLCELDHDPGFAGFRGRVKVPLPFPKDIYLGATTFKSDDQRKTFNDIVDGLPEEDVFVVYQMDDLRDREEALAESLEPVVEPNGLREKFEEDVDNSNNRHRRYQTAGEYVATFSDLLIAIYDDRHSTGQKEGSNGIVEAKRWGSSSGLLPLTHFINWSDNGPVFHLFHPRQKSTDSGIPDAKEDPVRSKSHLRILHPYDLGPKDDQTRELLSETWDVTTDAGKASQENEKEKERLLYQYECWQRRGNSLISRVVRNLREFNDLSPEDSTLKKEETALYDMCGVRESGSGSLEDQLKEALGGTEEGFKHAQTVAPMARLRRRAADFSNGLLEPKAFRTLRILFVSSFLAAVILHCFAHWHTFDHTTAYEYTEEGKAGHGDGHDKHHGPPVLYPVRLWLGLSVIGISLLGFLVFARFKSKRIEERRYDFRAMAEGLRVQFFWSLAGLRRTVAGNYMQRVRSEMDWVRNAISSVTFPAENFQSNFLRLSRRQQFTILNLVVEKWIRPHMRTQDDLGHKACNKNYQQDYFWATKKEKAHKLHMLHQSGCVIAMAGLLQLLLLIPYAYSPKFLGTSWDNPLFGPYLVLGGIILILVSAGLGAYVIALEKFPPADSFWRAICHESWHEFTEGLFYGKVGKKLLGKIKAPESKFLRKFLNALGFALFAVFRWCGTIFDLLFHFHIPKEKTPDSNKQLLKSFLNFLVLLIPSAGVAAALSGIGMMISQVSAKIPGPLDIGIIAMGTCLLGGALRVAFAERQLLPEHTRQFDAAHEFFASARRRLECNLDEMEVLVNLLENPDPSATPEELEALQKEFTESRGRIHELLFALGKEALDENSEWLILHRARPMEPVMAG